MKNLLWKRKLIFTGHILWPIFQTTPELYYEVCIISNIGKQPKVKMLLEANKALFKLKSYRVKLGKLKVIAYLDAMWIQAWSLYGLSNGGHIIFINGRNHKLVPINLQSKRLVRVCWLLRHSLSLSWWRCWFSCFISHQDLQYACSANSLLLHW